MAGGRVGAEPGPEVERWRWRRRLWQLGTECKVTGRVARSAWPLGTPVLGFFTRPGLPLTFTLLGGESSSVSWIPSRPGPGSQLTSTFLHLGVCLDPEIRSIPSLRANGAARGAGRPGGLGPASWLGQPKVRPSRPGRTGPSKLLRQNGHHKREKNSYNLESLHPT